MVEVRRFELLTFYMQGRCSPNWAIPPIFLVENTRFELVSLPCKGSILPIEIIPQFNLALPIGFEPTTYGLEDRCSSNWAKRVSLVEIKGVEPLTSCLQSKCSTSWAISPNILSLFMFSLYVYKYSMKLFICQHFYLKKITKKTNKTNTYKNFRYYTTLLLTSIKKVFVSSTSQRLNYAV